MQRILLEAARKIEVAPNLDRVWSIFVAALNELGIRFVVYLIASDAPPQDRFVLSNLPDEWPAKLMEDPSFNEPFLAHCCATFEITKIGSEFLPDHRSYLDEANERYIKDALSFNWRSGLGIPCQLIGSGKHGGFLIGNGADAFTFERTVLPLSNMLQSLCLIAHRRINTLRCGAAKVSVPKPLSVRERQTLELISRGMRPKQIAHELGLSEASIRLYLKNARAKLGARTKEEAVALIQNQSGPISKYPVAKS